MRGLPGKPRYFSSYTTRRDAAGLRIWSLPRIDPGQRFRYEIDLGVKGPENLVVPAFARLREGVLALGGLVSDQAGSDR